jgi:hypothetical protein
VINFPGKAGELATSVRVPATCLRCIGVRREHTDFGTKLLSGDARRFSHPVVKLGSALGPADVAPPPSGRGAVLFEGRQDLSAPATRPTW